MIKKRLGEIVFKYTILPVDIIQLVQVETPNLLKIIPLK